MNFSELLNETRNQDRILRSGLVKNLWKQNACKSSGPDLQIGSKVMWIGTDPDSWIRIREFLCGAQICIGSILYSTDPLLRILEPQTKCMCEGIFIEAW